MDKENTEMNIIPTVILKYAIAIIPLIIQIFAVRSGWVFPKDKIFTSRKNISEFAAALHSLASRLLLNGSRTNMVSPR